MNKLQKLIELNKIEDLTEKQQEQYQSLKDELVEFYLPLLNQLYRAGLIEEYCENFLTN